MSSRQAGRLVATCAVALFFIVAPFLPARGQEGVPRPPSPTTRFGIKAANLGKTTLEDGHFSYAIASGSTVKDAIVLINYSDEPLNFSIYPADMGSTTTGGLAPAQKDASMENVGKWTSLHDPETSTVGVGPKSQRSVPFTLQVPKGTPPGDYPGAIVAALNLGRSNRGLGVQTRAALLVDLNVVGKTNLKAVVGKLRAEPEGNGYRFEVDVRNTGNVLFTMNGEVELESGGDTIERVALSPRELYVIPKGKATLSGVWKDPPLIGRVKATAHIDALINKKPSGTFSSPPKMLTLFPVRLVASVLGAIVIAAAVWFGTRGLRRRRANRRREEREIIARHRQGRSPREASRLVPFEEPPSPTGDRSTVDR